MPNFLEEITNAQHPKDQIIYEKEDAVNKSDSVIRSLVKLMRLQKAEIAECYIPIVSQARLT